MAGPHFVKGHSCAGLVELQDASTYSCIPHISEDGCISGCDDTNAVPIRYCPMCGERLSVATGASVEEVVK